MNEIVRDQKDTAKRLREFLDYVKMGQSQFASEIGYKSYRPVHRILNGEGQVNFQFIQKLVKRFPSIDLNWLYTGIGKPTQEVSKEELGKQVVIIGGSGMTEQAKRVAERVHQAGLRSVIMSPDEVPEGLNRSRLQDLIIRPDELKSIGNKVTIRGRKGKSKFF